MEKNRGLTLVELIVVIAVMGVVVSLVGISVSVVSRQKVGSAASDVKGQLQAAQTISMSKDNCYVDIRKNSNGDVIFTTYSSADKVLDKLTIDRRINVIVHIGSTSYNITTGGSNVQILYERESGAFANSKVGGSTQSAAVSSIDFENGSKKVTLTLTKLTGKVTY